MSGLRFWLSLEGRSFLSLLLILTTLFTLVFTKTEVRRLGYEVWRETKSYRQVEDELRKVRMEYAELVRPERIRSQAVSRLTLGEARKGQIVQLLGDQVAVPQ